MSFTEKRLLGPTTLTTSASSALYTVPTGKSTIIKQIVATNTSASAATFTLYIGAATASNAIFSGTSVSANDSLVINLSQVLASTEEVRALASANSAINLTISGVENDGPLNPLSTYIADGAVTSAKIADGAIVNADINASAAIVDTKLATIQTANKVSIASLDIDGGTEIGAALSDLDLFVVDDGADGTNRKSFVSRIATYVFGKVGGAGTISSTGTLSLNGTSYITATYSSGWGKYPAGIFADASYGKTSNGVVLLNGLIRRTSGSDPVAFYLPSGYRPASTIIYGVAGSGGIGRIDVNADGSVYWVGTITGSVNIADWISLGGISFFAA